MKKLTDKNSIPRVLEAMTIREKAMLLSGGSLFSTLAFPKYDIPSISFVDCASGINLLQLSMDAVGHVTSDETMTYYDADEKLDGVAAMLKDMKNMSYALEIVNNGPTSNQLSPLARKAADYLLKRIPKNKLPTAFPSGIILGASWNKKAIYEVGAAVGKESAAYGVDVLLGSPNINIHRDPRNGRLFEGFSEDPYLVSELAPELVKGVQDQNIGANVKHFAANNQETLRIGINSHISLRALEEIYLPGYKSCVQKGNVMSVMSAYNSINGIPCAHNRWLLREKLREDWGFKGFTVCDWGGDYDRVQSLSAGVDLDMPGPRAVKDIMDAVSEGELDKALLDEACTRLLEAIVELRDKRPLRVDDFSVQESSEAAYNLAKEGITLLKNNGVLPISTKNKLSFWGEKCKQFFETGKGSTLVITDRHSSLYDRASEIAGPGNVLFEEIDDMTDAVVIVIGKTSSEGYDHDDLELPEAEKEIAYKAISLAKQENKRIVLILNSGTPCNVSDIIDSVDAFMWVYFPGQEGGKAAADIIYGIVNPSGKLPITYPRRYKDCPTYGNFPGECEDVYYSEGIFVGYRWFDTRDIDPLFEFGAGLSYTDFKISDVRISSDSLHLGKGERLNVSLKVTNTGKIAGSEVVQLYISDELSSIPKPEKELKYFEKVFLQPNEQTELVFELDEKAFGSFNPKHGIWDTEPGWYKILIGNSSRSITNSSRIYLSGHSIYDYGEDSLFLNIQSDERAWSILKKNLSDFMDVDSVSSAMFFTPFLPLKQVWNTLYAPIIEASGANSDRVFTDTCAELAELDVGLIHKIVSPLNS